MKKCLCRHATGQFHPAARGEEGEAAAARETAVLFGANVGESERNVS